MLSRDPGCLNQASCHPPMYMLQAAVRCVADLVFFNSFRITSRPILAPHPPTEPPLRCVPRTVSPRAAAWSWLWPSITAPRLRMHEAGPAPTYALIIRCSIKHNKTSSPLGVPRLKCVGSASCRQLVQSFRNPLTICIFLNLTFLTDLRRPVWFCQNAVVFSTFRVSCMGDWPSAVFHILTKTPHSFNSHSEI